MEAEFDGVTKILIYRRYEIIRKGNKKRASDIGRQPASIYHSEHAANPIKKRQVEAFITGKMIVGIADDHGSSIQSHCSSVFFPRPCCRWKAYQVAV